MNEEARPEVAFLDTNALHFIHLYLEHARIQRLYPFSPSEDPVAEANEQLGLVEERNLRISLERGLKAVESLSIADVRVEYSSVSELELIAGQARGRAVERAAKEGIPDRMWTRFFEREISARLQSADLTDIRERVERLSASLENAGVLATVSDEGRTRDVLDLAKNITGLVYLGFADSVIYASALVTGADYLITGDKYLRKTVNRIRNGEHPYDEVRRQLQACIAQITLDDPANVALPEARRMFVERQ